MVRMKELEAFTASLGRNNNTKSEKKNAFGRRKGTYVKKNHQITWHGQEEEMEAVAGKLAFRQYLKEQGIKKSERELEMQEIYNRFFFFRK